MLDLIEWTWSKITPSGPSPTQDRFGSRTSWLYEEKIYVFGGGLGPGTIFRVVVDSERHYRSAAYSEILAGVVIRKNPVLF